MIEDVRNFYTDFRTTAQFLFTGFLGVFIDNGILYLLHSNIGLSLAVSKAVAVELTIIALFFVNDNWTFQKEKQPGTVWKRLAKSNGIRLGGLVISVLVLLTLHEKLGIWLLLANIMSIGAGFVFNYTFESFAWKMHK